MEYLPAGCAIARFTLFHRPRRLGMAAGGLVYLFHPALRRQGLSGGVLNPWYLAHRAVRSPMLGLALAVCAPFGVRRFTWRILRLKS